MTSNDLTVVMNHTTIDREFNSLSNDMHNMHIFFGIKKKIMFLVDHDHHDVILVVKMTESGQTKTRFGILMKFWSDTIVDLG